MLNIHTKRLQNSHTDIREMVREILVETERHDTRQNWEMIVEECLLRQFTRREIAIVYRNVERYIY